MTNKNSNPIQKINDFINQARAKGLLHRTDEGETHDGTTYRFDGRDLVTFGSGGYMGMGFEPRVRQAAIAAIEKYGIEICSSRAYVQNPMLAELEELLERIFQLPTVVAPTTTLAHMSALPTLMGENDLVLLDQQVHSSVHMAAKLLKATGVQVEIVPHNNVSRIERKIKSYLGSKEKIWYLGDGVYSMYGDFAPVRELEHLLDKYGQFHLYLDDAHGMSWTGKHGKGYVLSQLPRHDRLYMATSLAKGFGTGGAALVCPNPEVKQLIRNCGGTMIFSGPPQPPILGAAVESAKIHLSGEFDGMQEELMRRIRYSTKLLENQPLPLLSNPDSPIRFLGVGATELAQEVVKNLIKQGFWLNIAQFPAVGPNHAGLRFLITRKTKMEDIERFTMAVRTAVAEVIGTDEAAISQIWSLFSKEYGYSLMNG